MSCSLPQISSERGRRHDPSRRPSHYKDYDPEALQQAVNSPLSPAAAAAEFGVPRSTVQDHRNSGGEQLDHRRYLQEGEEQQLLAWIFSTHAAGFPASDICVKQRALAIMEKAKRERHGDLDKWLANFKERHADALKQIRAKFRHPATEHALSREVLDQFYDRLEWYIVTYKLTAEQIFNMDETGTEMLGGKAKVWVPKDAREASVPGKPDKEHITIATTIRADGQVIPPLVLVKGEWGTIPKVWRLHGAPAGTRLAHTRKSPASCRSDSRFLGVQPRPGLRERPSMPGC